VVVVVVIEQKGGLGIQGPVLPAEEGAETCPYRGRNADG
jgi:hypothetical protein